MESEISYDIAKRDQCDNGLILTKSIYEPVDAKDGLRVLVTRYYPRGVKRERFDLWIRELSPSAKLLRSYKAGDIDWRKFSADFTKELDNTESQKALRNLQELSKKGNVTLLCYERAGENCHRLILERLLSKEK